ncbi:hypothetical protein BDF21DRAFT_96156 [Thamnidium elegans]|nr:hypothetical protein BDF21DRAFT_96156 [Thamnidium elegans]
MNTFLYEDGQENIFNEGEKAYDPMEDVLTYVDDPKIVLETITSRQTYLSVKRPKKNLLKGSQLYNNCSDFTRETFIDCMLEDPQERGTGDQVCKGLKY